MGTRYRSKRQKGWCDVKSPRRQNSANGESIQRAVTPSSADRHKRRPMTASRQQQLEVL
eukprot:NODE_11853_length_294_cov_13.730612_g10940_i0.p1 GENE.NODE_11853_length_294_cov_13.730612_g10940_i0~~NODE_11853_length_294_cov_13.730612_g10940_i0.p1  ORF type:complete len:69 (+),score=14.65 NODE_11853_length_294_cov_13.730612_g10940_i0:32-208(+)